MAILSQQQFMEAIKTIVGDNNDDNSLTFIENMTDTYNNLASTNADSNWKEKYEQNDAMWREKYRERFFQTESNDIDTLVDKPPVEQPKPKTYDDLFKEGV